MNTTTNILPRWAYLALALACVCMGLWASYVTLQFFEHGARALEADPALQALAVGAALLFVASGMFAFGLAAVLSERQLKARRWMLTGLAVAVLLLEIATITAVQMAMVSGADLAQSSVSDTVTDLQKQIATAEANAKTYAATAESLRAADQLKKASEQTDKATAETAKASKLYDRLEKARTQKRPTLTGLLGEKSALAYVIARGLLVSVAGLVFFGVAGALLRAARGGTLSVDAQLVTLLTELRDRPGALGAPVAPAQAVTLAAPAEIAAPVAPTPAQASYWPAGAVAPTGAPVGLSYGGKAMFGAGALAAMAAPVAHSAPAVPTQAKAPATPLASPANGASETVQAGASVSVQSHDAESVQSGASEMASMDASVSVQSGASVSVQSEAKKPRVKRAVSAKLDTGTDGKAGARYKRIKAAVKAGKLKPSLRAIQATEGGSQDVVLDYLRQLENEGVIVRAGRGFALASKTGGAA